MENHTPTTSRSKLLRVALLSDCKMAPATGSRASEAETIKFLLLCLDKCDTKSIDYEEIAKKAGLNGQKAAYKRMWDLKNRFRTKEAAGDKGVSISSKSPAKVTKSRSARPLQRKKKLEIDYKEKDDFVLYDEEASQIAELPELLPYEE
ncbi:hypothetical protein TWF694_003987 [Orbilia ellipsospora]|uniref:Myb-like DNA-binding domain-containing protein n=1 Tax=Orbilia ellipsospora TaxID=2528407 RepID=A0AAV9WYV8_9PEZI